MSNPDQPNQQFAPNMIGGAAAAHSVFQKEDHMSQMHSFTDELLKIAACKGRSGSTPIRVGKLAGSSVDKSKGHLKRASAASEVAEAAMSPFKKKLLQGGAVSGGSIAAWEGGKGVANDWRTGRAMRKQQEEYKKRMSRRQ